MILAQLPITASCWAIFPIAPLPKSTFGPSSTTCELLYKIASVMER